MHRDAAIYDRNFHDVAFTPGSKLAALYPQVKAVKVNSVHHQGIKDLAPGFEIEARCTHDGMIEAIRRPAHPDKTYVAAVQWHPEFHRAAEGTLDDSPILTDFLNAVATAKARKGTP